MPFQLTKDFFCELQELVIKRDAQKILDSIKDLHPADIADIYVELDDQDAKYFYCLLDGEVAADVLVELEEDERENLLSVLPGDVIARMYIKNMDSDDAADVISELPEDKQEEVLQFIVEPEHAGDIVDLLNYDEDTAGGMMAKELVKVNSNWTVQTCLREVALQAEEIDEIYYVYVVDNMNKLQGVLPIKMLITKAPDTLVSGILKADIISVKTDESSESVARIMDKYGLVALPVVDGIGRLVGRITIDDVVDVMREEADKNYQMVSGLAEDVEPSDSVYLLTRARLPWLLIGLLGGIMGAVVLGHYESDLAANAATAFFIPLIAAMGGNVGVQSSSIVVQGLANNSINIESTSKRVFKELLVALSNGIICASIIFLYNLFFTDSFALTVSVSSSLLIVILFASTFGTLVPLVLNHFKIDPAIATGPFITTTNDILGLFIYLKISHFMFSI